jgi:hypothetical protein
MFWGEFSGGFSGFVQEGFVLGELSRGNCLEGDLFRDYCPGDLSKGKCPGRIVQGELFGVFVLGICLLGFFRGICPTGRIFQGVICPFTI